MNDTVKSLQKAIAQKDNIINQQAADIDALRNKLSALKMIIERMERDFKADIHGLRKEVMGMAETQKKNTQSRQKFEAGYYQKIGE